jgi:hypothetical protein
MLYNIVYGITWGPMPWLLPAEIFPLRSRSKGMALATVSTILHPKMHAITDFHLGIQLDLQFHHRHGVAGCFRWHRWLLLPHHCWLLPVFRWTCLLVLRRDRWSHIGGNRCGIRRPSICIGQRGSDGYRRSQGQHPSRKDSSLVRLR